MLTQASLSAPSHGWLGTLLGGIINNAILMEAPRSSLTVFRHGLTAVSFLLVQR